MDGIELGCHFNHPKCVGGKPSFCETDFVIVDFPKGRESVGDYDGGAVGIFVDHFCLCRHMGGENLFRKIAVDSIRGDKKVIRFEDD